LSRRSLKEILRSNRGEITKSGNVIDVDSHAFESAHRNVSRHHGVVGGRKSHEEGFTTLRWKTLMTIKTLGVIALVTTALSSPVFAQDMDAAGPQKAVHALRHHRNAYNQAPASTPVYVAPRENGTYLENESFDRQRVGDHDPDMNPPGT